MARPSSDILVLGGGIIGLAIAYELAHRGLKVGLIDRGQIGSGASGSAAGMLAPLGETPQEGPLLDACRHSRDLWPSWAEMLEAETSCTVDYDRSGAVLPQLGPSDHLAAVAAAAEQYGEPCQPLTQQELRRLMPDIAPHVERALLLPGEHRIDNRLACSALAAVAHRRGVQIHEGCEVQQVRLAPDSVEVIGGGFRFHAAQLVLAAGAWSGSIDGLPRLPVRPVRGQMFELEGVDWPWRGSVRTPHHYVVRRRGGRLLVGATVEHLGFQNRVTPAGLGSLIAFLRVLFPGLSGKQLSDCWAGLRPGTDDGLPILGRWADSPLWIASGHYRNGILLAPWTAVRLAELLLDGADPSSTRAFSPHRFEGP